MKYSFLLVTLLLFAGCLSSEESPPDEVGDFPPDYIISLQDGEDDIEIGEGIESDETDVGEEILNEEELAECQEENAEMSLELDTLKKTVATCQKDLVEKTDPSSGESAIPGVKPEHLQLIRDSIIQSEQKEYSFKICGQMGTFIRNGWYESFSRQLTQARLRFANGFLETEDLFGGCQSTEGKMVFFLGAERGESLSFLLLKFNTAEDKLEPALMLDNATSSVVTEFGKREGSYVKFPSDDGRIFRYYYDANVVVEAP